ncbi:MAG: LutB/LldF family L-lactate oxidation iron-sulfur protein [Candidatus Adiutricales bacterium]
MNNMMFKPTDLDQDIDRGLKNEFLRNAMALLTAFSGGAQRLKIMDEVGGFENLRQRARASKDKVLNRLDYYLEKLEDSVQKAGGRVVWADGPQDVIDYIVSLAREKNVKSVVKGKSMVTEEIDLNPALQRAGLEVLETDLGEYIIQLAGERPSHIVGPALHKTKEEVARLFEEKLGISYTDDPAELTMAARRVLRESFLQADMGITGANFAVAETGTIVLLENEGNIRLSTTLPRIHVAVMGIEKVVADFNDLQSLLKVLPISTMNLRLPSYTSFITGPAGSEGEGPEEFHLVLLDDFRTKILADPDFRQMLRCIRCGACLNACPVYGTIGGHAYPWVYSGPMGVVLTALAKGPSETKDLLQASTLCRTCAEVCPVMIDLPGMILKLRSQAVEKASPLLLKSLAVAARLYSTPLGYDSAGRIIKAATKLALDSEGRIQRGPELIKNMGSNRRLPQPADVPFHRAVSDEDLK